MSMNVFRLWLAGVFKLISSVLAYADREGHVADTGKLEAVSVQLRWFHQFEFAGYYAAKEQGYYQDEGLDVEIRELSPGRSVTSQVISGEAEYGVGGSGIIADYAIGSPGARSLADVCQYLSLGILLR